MENQKTSKLTWRWNGKYVSEKQYKQKLQKRKLFKEIQEKRKRAKRDELENEPKCIIEGRRVIDLQVLAKYLFCRTCKICLSLRDVEREVRHGLASLFLVRCTQCNVLTYVPTSKKLLNLVTQKKRYQINTKVAAGCIQAGLSYGPLSRFLEALDIPRMTLKTFQDHENYVTTIPKDLNPDSEENTPTEVEIGPFDSIVTNVVSDSTEAKPPIEIVPMPAKQIASILPGGPSIKTPLVTRSYTRKSTLPEFEPRGKRAAALKKPCECCINRKFSSQTKKRKCYVQGKVEEKPKNPKKTTKHRKSENFSVGSYNGFDIHNGITPKTEPCDYEVYFDHDYAGYNFVEDSQAIATEPSFTFISTCKMEVDSVDDVIVKNESNLTKINDIDLDANYPVICNVSSESMDDKDKNSFCGDETNDTHCKSDENATEAESVTNCKEAICNTNCHKDPNLDEINNTCDGSNSNDSLKIKEISTSIDDFPKNRSIDECDANCIKQNAENVEISKKIGNETYDRLAINSIEEDTEKGSTSFLNFSKKS